MKKVKQFLRVATQNILSVILIVFIVAGVYLRFKNPDVTETRLLIMYWRQYLLMVLVLVVYGLMVYKGRGE